MNYYPSRYSSSHHGASVIYPNGGYDPGYVGTGMPTIQQPYMGGSVYGGVPMSAGAPYEMVGSAPPIMYTPSSVAHRSRRHRSGRHRHGHHHHHSSPEIITPAIATSAYPYGAATSVGSHYYPYGSFRERLARWFGFGRYGGLKVKREDRKESWGFLGSRRRRRYYNQYGTEVDRKGRPVIRV